MSLVLYVAAQVAIGWLQRVVRPPYQAILPPAVDVAAAVVAIVLYRLLVERAEQRRPSELPAYPNLDALWGFVIGAALLCLVQAIAVAAGAAHIGGLAGMGHVLPVLCAAIFAAIAEEIVFRGIVFRLLWEAAGLPVAVIASAAFFGGLHMLNPGATLFGACAIAVEAGVMLGLGYALTGDLWLAIGMHCGWNFFEGGIFGGAVSSTEAQGLLLVESRGSPLLTGGSFGLEASLQAIALCTCTSLLFAYLVRRRRSR